MIKRLLLGAVAAIAVALAIPVPSVAQPSGSFQAITPLTRDIGNIRTLTAATAATYNSADVSGFNVSTVLCTIAASTKVGSPTYTLSIQNKDAASGYYQNAITSPSLSSTGSGVAIAAGANLVDVAGTRSSTPIAATWRVSVVVSGTTSVTGTVGCSVK